MLESGDRVGPLELYFVQELAAHTYIQQPTKNSKDIPNRCFLLLIHVACGKPNMWFTYNITKLLLKRTQHNVLSLFVISKLHCCESKKWNVLKRNESPHQTFWLHTVHVHLMANMFHSNTIHCNLGSTSLCIQWVEFVPAIYRQFNNWCIVITGQRRLPHAFYQTLVLALPLTSLPDLRALRLAWPGTGSPRHQHLMTTSAFPGSWEC